MMKKIIVLALSFMGCLTAMEKPEPYNGLIFLTVDNKTNKDWKIDLLGHGDSKIEKRSKESFSHAMPMERGEFVIGFREPGAFFLDTPLGFFVHRYNFGEIEFKLAPKKLKDIVKRLTFDPAAKDDAYAVNITLDGDQLEKSSFEVTQIKNAKFIRLLKDYQFKNNGRSAYGSTPLIRIFYDDPRFTTQELREVVSFLINAGANLNAQTKEGWTALQNIASSSRNDLLGIARLLLEAGANPNIQNVIDDTPLLLALFHKKNDVARLLINSGANVNLSNKVGVSPLLTVAGPVNYNLGLAKLLIEAGADINYKNTRTGSTPLHYAVYAGNQEMATLLLEKGANMILRNNDGKTPIGLAQDFIEKGEMDKKPIFDLLNKALAESQKRYVQEWKQKFSAQP